MSDYFLALFAGLDVSLTDTHVCEIDADGKTVFEAVVPSEPDVLAKTLAEGAPGCENIAIETGATTPGFGVISRIVTKGQTIRRSELALRDRSRA